MNKLLGIVCAALFALLPLACKPGAETVGRDTKRPRIVATTTIIGDMVRRIGGEDIELRVLVPPYADPHDYMFRPADMVVATQGDLLFINGAGLEGHLDRLLRNVTRSDRVVSLMEGIPIRHMDADHSPHHMEAEDCDDDTIDPHVWTDPHNMMIWVSTIARSLSELTPQYADRFAARAEAVTSELEALDTWIRDQVETIPVERRLLVTDHHALGYFADRYGFEEAGVIIRSLDSVAQPSARDLVRLVGTLRDRQIGAIFIGKSVNPQLASQIARDYSLKLVPLYSGALSAPDGPASDYFAYMRYNVNAMVRHLQ